MGAIVAEERSQAAEILTAYLAGRDAPCPSCAYNLRDLRTHQCPECGLALRLLVQPAISRFGAFLTGLVGLSAGVGFAGIFLGYVFQQGLPYDDVPSLFRELLPLVLGVLIGAPLLIAWIAGRRAIARCSPSFVWTLAGACWMLTLATILWFFISIS